MKNFTLVNPSIEGSIQTSFQAKNSDDAAVQTYKTLSAYFANNIPHFSFTMKEGSKYHHYTAKEKKNSSGKIKFTIKKNDCQIENSKIEEFLEEVSNMSGGRSRYKYDDSDSSSSESSDYRYYKPMKRHEPIQRWSYYPYYYYPSYTTKYYPTPYYYVPQFVTATHPYIYIKLSDS